MLGIYFLERHAFLQITNLNLVIKQNKGFIYVYFRVSKSTHMRERGQRGREREGETNRESSSLHVQHGAGRRAGSHDLGIMT